MNVQLNMLTIEIYILYLNKISIVFVSSTIMPPYTHPKNKDECFHKCYHRFINDNRNQLGFSDKRQLKNTVK